MKRALPVIALVGLIAWLTTALQPSGWRTGPPLDPRSTDADGARAAVLLLQSERVDVAVSGVPAPGEVGTLVVLVDDLDGEQWKDVARFAEGGGDVVVADVTSPLASPRAQQVTGTDIIGSCEIPGFEAVASIDVPVAWVFERGDRSCLEVDVGPIVVERRLGEGRVLSVGTAQPWRNDRLVVADHAALVVATGRWGSPPVRILDPRPVGTGTSDLTDLVASWVWAGLAQLGVAAALYALWRGTRLGRPIAEEPPSAVDPTAALGAEVSLTGAALSGVLTASLRRRWEAEVRTVAMHPDGSLEQLAARFDMTPAERDALAEPLTDHDDAQLHLSALGRLRRIVLDGDAIEVTDRLPSQPTLEIPWRER